MDDCWFFLSKFDVKIGNQIIFNDTIRKDCTMSNCCTKAVRDEKNWIVWCIIWHLFTFEPKSQIVKTSDSQNNFEITNLNSAGTSVVLFWFEFAVELQTG